MSNNAVLDFVNMFMPEHLQYWKDMEYVKTLKLSRSNLITDDCEHLVLFPHEAGVCDFTFNEMKRNISEVKFIMENEKASYDVLFWNNISNYYPSSDYSKLYDFIFENPEKYKKDLRNCKTIGGCFKKLKNLIPQRYFEIQYEGKDFFGEFSVKLDTIHFESRFEKINFSHDEVYLIPYFIEYRNRNLLNWIYQEKSYKKCINEFGIAEITGKINEIAVKSKVTAEEFITSKIRNLLHQKGYYEGIKIDWNYDYANRLISVSYIKKNSLFDMTITKTLRAYNINEDLEKLEKEL